MCAPDSIKLCQLHLYIVWEKAFISYFFSIFLHLHVLDHQKKLILDNNNPSNSNSFLDLWITARTLIFWSLNALEMVL